MIMTISKWLIISKNPSKFDVKETVFVKQLKEKVMLTTKRQKHKYYIRFHVRNKQKPSRAAFWRTKRKTKQKQKKKKLSV